MPTVLTSNTYPRPPFLHQDLNRSPHTHLRFNYITVISYSCSSRYLQMLMSVMTLHFELNL